MAASSMFDAACDAVESRTQLGRLEVRGTMRLALRAAGLDPATVDGVQLKVVLKKLLPGELRARGVPDPVGVCDAVATAIAGLGAETSNDRFTAAGRTLDRLGRG